MLGPFLRDYGELLPLDCPDAEIVAFNPTIILDALDEKASEIKRLASGRPFHIKRHSFRPEIVAEADIFKISNIDGSQIFFSERAVSIWESTKVTGVEFTKVWEQLELRR